MVNNEILNISVNNIFAQPRYNGEKFKIVARKKAHQNRSNLKWDNKQKREEA